MLIESFFLKNIDMEIRTPTSNETFNNLCSMETEVEAISLRSAISIYVLYTTLE